MAEPGWRADRTERRRRRGGAARESGRSAEWIAALWLLLTGWRVVGFRLKTRQGEIDLLARRGRVLAIVEVKRRATLAEALEAVGPVQQQRLARAAAVLAAQPAHAGLSVRLDLLALAPGRLPRHIANAWSPAVDGPPMIRRPESFRTTLPR